VVPRPSLEGLAIELSDDRFSVGWIVGLVVGLTSVILAALLWSSRQL
jgi:hypothetical protein